MIVKINAKKIKNFHVTLRSSKNITLPILCGCLLSPKKITLTNLTDISDITNLLKIFKSLGVHFIRRNHTILFDKPKIKSNKMIFNEVSKLRASYYLWPVLLNRFNYIESSLIGGCKFCDRPIDEHIRLFNFLGYSFSIGSTIKISKIPSFDIPKVYRFNKVSVGATINALLLCAFKYQITLENPNLEPEVLEVINFLNYIGANIKVISNTIVIMQKRYITQKLKYHLVYDRIEASSYILLGLCSKISKVTIKNIKLKYLRQTLKLIKLFNCNYKYNNNTLIIFKQELCTINSLHLEFGYFPLLSSDLNPIVCASVLGNVLTYSYSDHIFQNRDSFIIQLKKHGYQIFKSLDRTVIKNSNNPLNEPFDSSDLRCSFALFMLLFNSNLNEATFLDFSYIKRGYNNFFKVLDLNKIQYHIL